MLLMLAHMPYRIIDENTIVSNIQLIQLVQGMVLAPLINGQNHGCVGSIMVTIVDENTEHDRGLNKKASTVV